MGDQRDDRRRRESAARARLERDPADLDAAADLAWCLRQVAFDYVTQTEDELTQDQARTAALESVALMRTVVARLVDDADALAALFFSLHALAEVMTVVAPAEAVATYWEAAVVGQRRLALDPDPDQVRRELSWTLRDAGALMSGDSQEAAALLTQAVALAREHLRARPDDLEATRELSWVLMVAAEHCADGDPARALALYRESVLAATQVYDADPDATGARSDLWLALTGVADLLQALDRPAAEAIRAQADRLEIGR